MTEQISSFENQEQPPQVLIKDVAGVLGIETQKITLAGLIGGSHKKRRFAYGFTLPTIRNGQETPAGFFKISGPKHAKQLRREGLAIKVAGEQLGVPIVGLITPLRELSGDRVILAKNEQVSEANPALGARAARTLCVFSGRQVPEGVNDSVFKRGDWRNKSPRCFWRKWQRSTDEVFDPRFQKMVDSLIGSQNLRLIVDQAEKEIRLLIEAEVVSGAKYFVHNDTSPSNIFFGFNGETLLLDFEHAGVTRHQVLALMTDLGNYSGRCWPNPKMQEEFLVECLKNENLGNLNDRYKLVRGVVVFGAIYLAQHSMSQRHKEHQMSVSLLSHLEPALSRVDREYTRLSSSC